MHGYMCGEAGHCLTVSSNCNLHRWDQIAKNTSEGWGVLVGLDYLEVASAWLWVSLKDRYCAQLLKVTLFYGRRDISHGVRQSFNFLSTRTIPICYRPEEKFSKMAFYYFWNTLTKGAAVKTGK